MGRKLSAPKAHPAAEAGEATPPHSEVPPRESDFTPDPLGAEGCANVTLDTHLGDREGVGGLEVNVVQTFSKHGTFSSNKSLSGSPHLRGQRGLAGADSRAWRDPTHINYHSGMSPHHLWQPLGHFWGDPKFKVKFKNHTDLRGLAVPQPPVNTRAARFRGQSGNPIPKPPQRQAGLLVPTQEKQHVQFRHLEHGQRGRAGTDGKSSQHLGPRVLPGGRVRLE